jgi:hypothetical protein
MSRPLRRTRVRPLLARFALFSAGITALAYIAPGIASATIGETTEQALFSEMNYFLSPHTPLGGSSVWYTPPNPTYNKFFELNENLESTAFTTSAPTGTEGLFDLTQGSDGNIYWTFAETFVGEPEVGFIGKYVKSSGTTSYINLPTSPGTCGPNPEHILPECGIDLAPGPEETLWYAQYRQFGAVSRVAKIGRIKIKEAGPPITQYNLPNAEALPFDIIEGGGIGCGSWRRSVTNPRPATYSTLPNRP